MNGAPDDEADEDGGSSVVSRALNLGGLVLVGMVLLALLLHGPNLPPSVLRGEGEDSAHRGPSVSRPAGPSVVRSPDTGQQSPSLVRDGGRRVRSGLPLMLPHDARLPRREPVAGLPGALERFGEAFTIRHPAYLPADVAPFTVQWQPAADPDRRARGDGELLTWFYSAEHGSVLVLAQGPGVGVWPLTAGDDRAGRLRLADGTEVIWVVGHPLGSPPIRRASWSGRAPS
jgi:hypothetical protein